MTIDISENDHDPLAFVAGIGRAWLAAELYARNEQAHQGYEARVGIVTAMESRIERMSKPTNWREEMRKWFEAEQIAIAYLKHGIIPVPPKKEKQS